MDSKEAIIGKIISDAEEKSLKIKEKSELDAGTLISKAEDFANDLKEKLSLETKENEKEAIRRRKTVAELDSKKLLLKAKQDVLKEIFVKTENQMASFSKKDYLSFVEKLLIESAENGDEIELSNDKVLEKEDILKLKVFSEKNLKVKDTNGNFVGGVKLYGKICDKDLTFKAIISAKKEELITKISKKLF